MNIFNLPITDKEMDSIQSKMDQMSLYGGISVRIVQSNVEKVVIRVEQMNLRLGVIYSKKELAARARKVIEPILGKIKIFYWPIVFQPKVDSLDVSWLKSKMEHYKLKIKDIALQLNIDQSEISNILIGYQPFTKFHRSAFFYFFHTLSMHSKVKNML